MEQGRIISIVHTATYTETGSHTIQGPSCDRWHRHLLGERGLLFAEALEVGLRHLRVARFEVVVGLRSSEEGLFLRDPRILAEHAVHRVLRCPPVLVELLERVGELLQLQLRAPEDLQ